VPHALRLLCSSASSSRAEFELSLAVLATALGLYKSKHACGSPARCSARVSASRQKRDSRARSRASLASLAWGGGGG